MKRSKNRELEEKNKSYQKTNTQRSRDLMLLLFFLLFTFFLASGALIKPPITEKGEVSRIGDQIPFAVNRSATLVSATYSERQEMMEVVLNFVNTNYDNIDTYYYTLELTGAKGEELLIEETYNEELFTVLRIRNVPKDYREMRLYFAPQTVKEFQITDEITGELILNEHNVKAGAIDLAKTKEDYLTDRMDQVIAGYEDLLLWQQKKLQSLEDTKAALEKENREIRENKAYMTDYEIRQKEDVAAENESAIKEVEAEIKKQQEKVARTRKEIESAGEKRDRLQ